MFQFTKHTTFCYKRGWRRGLISLDLLNMYMKGEYIKRNEELKIQNHPYYKQITYLDHVVRYHRMLVVQSLYLKFCLNGYRRGKSFMF